MLLWRWPHSPPRGRIPKRELKGLRIFERLRFHLLNPEKGVESPSVLDHRVEAQGHRIPKRELKGIRPNFLNSSSSSRNPEKGVESRITIHIHVQKRRIPKRELKVKGERWIGFHHLRIPKRELKVGDQEGASRFLKFLESRKGS